MYDTKTVYYAHKGVDRRGKQTTCEALWAVYIKIIKVNLSHDTYEVIKLDEHEKQQAKGYSEQLSTWFYHFGISGQVHKDDLEGYLAKTNLSYIASYFNDHKTMLQFTYRRKVGDTYKKAMMEIIPAEEYTDENKIMFCYVKMLEK